MNKSFNRSWLGKAELLPREDVFAGSRGTWILTYTVGKFGVDDGGSIRVARRSVCDSETPQFNEPQGSGYTTVNTNAEVRLLTKYDGRGNIRPWRGALQIDVRDGSLKEGDVVKICFGDRSQGGPGFRIQTFRECEHIFKVLVDCFGTGRFEELSNSPRIKIVGGPVNEIQVVGPSEAVTGTPTTFTVRALDCWGNRSDEYRGRISFRSTDPQATLPEDYSFTEEDCGAKKFNNLVLRDPGPHRILVKDDKGHEAASNPVIVKNEETELKLFWGDIHGQTKQTVGTGTLNEYFSFARDVAALDFCSWQGNDFQVTKDLWKEVKEVAKRFHKPGGFIVYLGYEWSGLTPAGGDYNIYYLGEDEEIYRSNHWLIEDRSDEETDRYPISELWETFKDRRDVMAVAHVGGRHANFDYHHPEHVPLIEVHSHHGTFEWFLEEALNRELKVGFIANSDDHTCRPGLSYPTYTPTYGGFCTRGGYVGVYSKELSKEAVWDALWERRCYATTGKRVIIWTEADGHPMGEEFEGNSPPTLKVRVVGTSPLHEVEIKRGVKTIYRHPFAQPRNSEDRLIKIEWSGSRVKSRLKKVDWQGGLYLDKGRIVSFKEFAFDYLEEGIRQVSNQRIEWNSTTGGDPDGVLLTLDSPEDDVVYFYTKPTSFSFKVKDVSYEPKVVKAGSLNQVVKISAITSKELPSRLEFTYQDKHPSPGLNPYWLRVVQSDGTMAWSSPIYFNYIQQQKRR